MADPVTDPPKAEPPVADLPKVDPPVDPPKVEDEFDKDRALATIKAQREAEDAAKKAAKDAERERDKLAARLKEIEDAEKTELEREREAREQLENENPRLKEQLQDARLQVALANPTLGIADPEIAATLLKERGLKFADDGSPENLTEAVEALLTAKPLLRGNAEPPKPPVPNIDAGAGQGNGPQPNLTAEELDAAKELGQDPILFAELKRARKENGGMMTYEQYQAAVERANAAKT